jgi:hypothetical protein
VGVDLGATTPHAAQALRLLCLGDVARRVSEKVEGVPARLIVFGDWRELRRAVHHLGVVLDGEDGTRDPVPSPDQVDVLVAAAGQDRGAQGAPRSLGTFSVAAVSSGRGTASSGSRLDRLVPSAGWEDGGLIERLALLRPHPWEAITLSEARRHRAAQTLDRWRFKVASWKDMPAAQAPPAALDAVHRALIDSLDTGTVLQLLHRMEVDHEVPSGSKFSMFVTVDRVLGLDLKKLLGAARWVRGSG